MDAHKVMHRTARATFGFATEKDKVVEDQPPDQSNYVFSSYNGVSDD
jgi:hypothetical protein